jgi:hypothetical protein
VRGKRDDAAMLTVQENLQIRLIPACEVLYYGHIRGFQWQPDFSMG